MSGRISFLDVATREKVFAEKLHNKDNTKEYVSGFKDVDSRCYIKCLKCNTIYSINATTIRNKAKYIRCLNCERIEGSKIKEDRKNKQKQIVLEKRNRKKEITRIRHSLEFKQIEFDICVGCGNMYMKTKDNIRYCSEKCANRQQDRRKEYKRRIRTKVNGNFDNNITLDKLIYRDKNICYLCGKKCNVLDFIIKDNTFIAGNYYPSIEHIKPLSLGGTHTWDNIKLAHRICNTLKGNKI